MKNHRKMSNIPLFPDLTSRNTDPELMDDPDSDQARLEKTLGQFSLINRWLSRVRHVLQQKVISVMQMQPDRTYHLVDLGAGGCDTAAWLLQYSRSKGLKLKVTACDHDPRVVRYARERYGTCPGLTILQRNLTKLADLSAVDFVFTNHLLHHLSDTEITELLQRLSKLNPRLTVMVDIHRRRPVYAGYYLLTLLNRSNSFVRYDGLLSIRKGFQPDELEHLALEAGLKRDNYQVNKLFPGHLIFTYRSATGQGPDTPG
ncbi:MAG: methyltransferase domain-containing protein [Lentisphaeria bacterium]